jgi:hypothetical protein
MDGTEFCPVLSQALVDQRRAPLSVVGLASDHAAKNFQTRKENGW